MIDFCVDFKWFLVFNCDQLFYPTRAEKCSGKILHGCSRVFPNSIISFILCSCSCQSIKFLNNLDSKNFKKWPSNRISGQMAKLYTNSDFEINKRTNGYSTSNICCTCPDNRSINDTQIVRPITPTSIDIQIVPSMMGKTHRMLCTICPFYIVHIV